jgi:hypothetical protein
MLITPENSATPAKAPRQLAMAADSSYGPDSVLRAPGGFRLVAAAALVVELGSVCEPE